jgi:tRNA pseudouridine38-40 synthase
MSGHPHYAILQYHGRDFCGWQRQRSERTVQGVLEDALERLIGRHAVTHAAGRTDAGVHALGQVVSFEAPTPWEAEKLKRALNATTPSDLWIAEVGRARPGFHARKDAMARRYCYVVGCDPAAASPFRRECEWDLARPLDRDALVAGAAVFIGEHDFRAYSTVGPEKPHHRCRIAVAEWHERPGGEGFIFTIEADRFLHRMVRFLTGAMVEVALGHRPGEDLTRLLQLSNNSEASPPAPPKGLYMVCARYPDSCFGHGT